MKHLKFYSLSLAAMLLAAPPCSITAWAQGNPTPISNLVAKMEAPRFSYIQSASIKVDPSSSGVNYNVRVSGIDEVTTITGLLTIYKDGSQIYSKRLSSSSNTLRASGTIASKGSGSYVITFSGTVYTATDSETIDMDMEDSY